MKVVESGYKIDLHIHSVCSRTKDKGKVAFNTIDNVGVLAEKLNDNGVQMCAITDHDAFEFDMYKALKAYESDEQCSVVKVFPGVEFTVEFIGEKGPTVLHVITVFNDEDETKVAKIAACLVDDKGKTAYDKTGAFSEEKFLSILRSIDLDTVLIVHQKSSLTTSHPYKNDAKTVGEEKFQEFVYTDYFEAFEFKNRKNEVFNKNFLNAQNLMEDIRFITGDKKKCLREMLNRLQDLYREVEDNIEEYKKWVLFAFKHSVNHMRCFFKNANFECENEYRIVLKIPEGLLVFEECNDDIVEKGQFKRGNILIPYIDYKYIWCDFVL